MTINNNVSIPIAEQETTINFTRNGKECVIWTCDTTVMTKLDKLYPCTKEHKQNGIVWAREYTLPKRLLSFRSDESIRPKNPPKRTLSAKQLAVLAKMQEQHNLKVIVS